VSESIKTSEVRDLTDHLAYTLAFPLYRINSLTQVLRYFAYFCSKEVTLSFLSDLIPLRSLLLIIKALSLSFMILNFRTWIVASLGWDMFVKQAEVVELMYKQWQKDSRNIVWPEDSKMVRPFWIHDTVSLPYFPAARMCSILTTYWRGKWTEEKKKSWYTNLCLEIPPCQETSQHLIHHHTQHPLNPLGWFYRIY
jgi:hypothetical protein